MFLRLNLEEKREGGEEPPPFCGKGRAITRNAEASSGFKKLDLATAAMSGLFWNGYAPRPLFALSKSATCVRAVLGGCARTSVHDERAGSGLSQDDV